MAQLIDPIGKLSSTTPIQKIDRVASSSKQVQSTDLDLEFSKILQQALEETNNDQLEAEWKTDEFAAGRLSNIHDVLISAEKAAMSLRLTLEVRNKIVDAYREIMRMQL